MNHSYFTRIFKSLIVTYDGLQAVRAVFERFTSRLIVDSLAADVIVSGLVLILVRVEVSIGFVCRGGHGRCVYG